MDNKCFRLDLDLQSISIISILGKLYDAPGTRNKIRNYFLKRGQNQSKDENDDEIFKIFNYLNTFALPDNITNQLPWIVKLMGEKIDHWIHYVTKVLQLDLSFTEKIYWNSHGTIDETKIFDLSWMFKKSGSKVVKVNSFYYFNTPIFTVACKFGHERFIKEHADDMIKELSNFYPAPSSFGETYNIMSVSICLAARENVEENISRPINMFRLCVDSGFSNAAKFYWKRLSDFERTINGIRFAEKCVQECSDMFVLEKRCEILIFLINQMPEEEKRSFFKQDADRVIITFLSVWPYQKLVPKLHDYDWNIVPTSRAFKLLEFLIKCDWPGDMGERNELYFKTLKRVWEGMPEDDRLSFAYGGGKILFSNFDVPTLNLILRDPVVRNDDTGVSEHAIETGLEELIDSKKFEFVDELVAKVLTGYPGKAKKRLKKNRSHVLVNLVENGRFDVADRFLSWLSDSEEERVRFKREINAVQICRNLTERSNDFELAGKFLKWRLETEVEVKYFKEEMKSYNFIITTMGDYVRIRRGDLSNFESGDYIARSGSGGNNPVGFILVKYEDADVSTSGIVLGIKKDKGPRPASIGNRCPVLTELVDFVGKSPGDFVLHNVFKIWKEKGKSDAGNLSNAFIKFYYETDEEVLKFKETKLNVINTENLVEYLFKNLFKDESHVQLDVLDDFFKFCLIPPDKVEEVKIRLRSGVSKLMDLYLIDQCNFGLADFCLEWLYDTPGRDKKTEAIRKSFVSKKWAWLCSSILKNVKKNKYFLNRPGFQIPNWLALVKIKDLEKLRNDLYALNVDPPNCFEWFLD